MARVNKKGTSYCSLGLERSEENILKEHLTKKKWSAKRYLRFLIRKDLKINIKLEQHG